MQMPVGKKIAITEFLPSWIQQTCSMCFGMRKGQMLKCDLTQ